MTKTMKCPGVATEYSDGKDIAVNDEVLSDTKHADGEYIDANANMVSATDPSADEATDADAEMVSVTKHSQAEPETNKTDEDNAMEPEKANAQIFQITISLRDA